MDMAVANLFKHKIRFELESKGADLYEPTTFLTYRYYHSPNIENVKSLGLNDVNDLCTILCKPFVLYVLSKVIHEDHVIPIDRVTINIGVVDFQEGDYYGLTRYCFETPLDSPELFFTHSSIDSLPFPEHLLNERTNVFVHVRCFYPCESLRREVRFRRVFNYYTYWRYNFSIEDYSDDESSVHENRDKEFYDSESTDEEEYTPPIETYRQDHCVVCLESKPNILYLDCMHIAICDSCDRLKKTVGERKKCDVCRAKISRRMKI